MTLDVSALFASVGSVAKLLVFFILFLIVRGTPAMLLYRSVLDRRERIALSFFSSTQPPLVVAITDLAVTDGHMPSSTAAARVGAGAISTLAYPLIGLRVARPAPTVGQLATTDP